MPRSSRRDQHRQQGARGAVGEQLGGPISEHRDEDDRMSTSPVAMVSARTREHDHAQRVADHDHAGVGRRDRRAHRRTGRTAARAGAAGPRRARRGTGSWVCEATSSGPAARARPSPRLDDPGRREQPTEAATEPGWCDPVPDHLRHPGHEDESLDGRRVRRLADFHAHVGVRREVREEGAPNLLSGGGALAVRSRWYGVATCWEPWSLGVAGGVSRDP